MKEKIIEMPEVSKCEIDDCAYNVKLNCHARAITVGDGETPGCDTYFKAKQHTNGMGQLAGVGACKVSACLHNQNYECMAQDILVGMSGNLVECLTFEK